MKRWFVVFVMGETRIEIYVSADDFKWEISEQCGLVVAFYDGDQLTALITNVISVRRERQIELESAEQ